MVRYNTEKVDTAILEAISEFEGIPTPFSLSEALGYSNSFISTRFLENPTLKAAAEKRAVEYIDSLSAGDLAKESSKKGGLPNQVPNYQNAKARLYERIDNELILPAIQSFNGIPNSTSLSKILHFSGHALISTRFLENPTLKAAAEKRAVEYIDFLSAEDLAKKTATGSGLLTQCNQNPNLLKRLYERIDNELILPAIQSFNGIPNQTPLSKILHFSGHSFISTRFLENPTLKAAAERKALEYIDSLSLQDLAKESSKVGGLATKVHDHPNLLKRLYERIDNELILPAIQSFNGIPNPFALSKVLHLNHKTISSRIYSNPILFLAMAEKQGLTADQAVELALERNERSEAVRKTLEDHLKDLYAFREILGLLRVFSDLFQKAKHILEVSLYPAPLGKASELDNLARITCYADLYEFRTNPNVTLEGEYNLVVLQGIHRVSNEAFNQLLVEVYKTLPVGSSVLVTYSTDYAVPDTMEAALRAKGFELREAGLMEIHPPDMDELNGLDEAERLRRKISGESHILHLVRLDSGSDTQVPALVKIEKSNGDGKPLIPNGTELEIPSELLKKSHAVFTPSVGLASPPDAPVLVTVTDENGDRVALFGYDMNPAKPKTLEVRHCSGAKDTGFDFRRAAKEMIRSSRRREALGVKTDKESTVPLGRLRS